MDLYQAMLSRHSTRRFREESVGKEMLSQIDEIASEVEPLVADNRFRTMRRDVVSGEDLIAAMGGYGRVVTPPHFLMGYVVGDRSPLVDLGFRMEQIAVHLAKWEISSCFIGSLGRETDVRVRFHLNRNARTAAFLIFGYPAASVTGRTINAVIRTAARGVKKLEAKDVFYRDGFGQPVAPPRELVRVIEAGCHAPSANNTQPCRHLWLDDTLYLFVERQNARYGKGASQDYRYFDAGAHMANMTIAMASEGMLGDWELLKTSNIGVPDHPETLEPLAKIKPR